MARKRVYTTGQVAKICMVTPRTVCKWVDDGRLKGYRIPGGNDRRIPTEQFVRFLKENNFPLDMMPLAAVPYVVTVCLPPNERQRVVRSASHEFGHADNEFEAGILCQIAPDVLIVDLCIGIPSGTLIASRCKETPLRVGIVPDGMEPPEGLAEWFGLVLQRPYDIERLVAAVNSNQEV